MIACTIVILFFCGRVIVGGFINTAQAEKYVIILGPALENGQPVKDLYSRVETGQKYWEQHDGVTLILTGGNPDESGRTEAGVMRDIRAERGVPEEQMYLEDKAETKALILPVCSLFKKPLCLNRTSCHYPSAIADCIIVLKEIHVLFLSIFEIKQISTHLLCKPLGISFNDYIQSSAVQLLGYMC